MLASGQLQEIETCKVSARYADKFETLSTSYAWARISALQLLPGIVMCVCNISLITISYKTYNYRKRLIGAIGTIMNVNGGFERDGNPTMESKDEEERRRISRDDDTKLALPGSEFRFSSSTEKHSGSNDSKTHLVSSGDLEQIHPTVREGCVDSCKASDFDNCEQCAVLNDDNNNDNDTVNSEGFELDRMGVKETDKKDLHEMDHEERKATQELDRILHESDRDQSCLFQNTEEDCQTNIANVKRDIVLVRVEIANTSDLRHTNASCDNEKDDDSLPNSVMNPSPDSEIATVVFKNGSYESSDEGNQSSLRVPSLKTITQNLTVNDQPFLPNANGCHLLPKENDSQFLPILENRNSLIEDSSNSCLELYSPQISKDTTPTEAHDDTFKFPNCLNNHQVSFEDSKQSLTDSDNNTPKLRLSIHRRNDTSCQNTNEALDAMQTKEHQNIAFLYTIPPERKGSDISSVISSTIVDDTMMSDTLTENNTKTSRYKRKPNSSPKRRGRDEGSVAELRPTIMLVLVTSCTLFAELMVTVAIFINFMNQVVYKNFVDEDTLVTFILVSNLITMVSFPINFMFFYGLSRPFRTTLIAYAHFVMRKLSVKFK